MLKKLSMYLKKPRYFALATAIGLVFNAGSAFSAIEQPVKPSAPAVQSSTILETREILDRASDIVFQGAYAVQKLQTLATDSPTTEMLKNYMATMIYVPHAMALPTDAEALDEPWLASTAGTTLDEGMVVPHALQDEADDDKDLDLPISAKKLMRLVRPVQNAMITSGFGFRWGRPHQGIDMAAPIGTPILAAENGKVVYSGWVSGYGNFISIDHGHGYETHYAHCSKLLVHVGQSITKGQTIGKIGSTGHSTGPHLHFEVIANGVHRNPIKFLNHTLAVVEAH